MTLAEAKALKVGDYIHTPNKHNADGTPMRARVTSVKRWKTRPTHVQFGWKRGMYEFGKETIKDYNQADLMLFELGYGS